MPLDVVFAAGHPMAGNIRPGADYRTALQERDREGECRNGDMADKLAGGGLTSPKGFVPPDCPRCGRQMKLLWRGTPHLGCPKKLHGCGLAIALRRVSGRYHPSPDAGYLPDWPAGHGLTVEQQQEFLRGFRQAVAVQLRRQARPKDAAALAAQIPAELRLARALSMFPQWFLRAGRTHQLMRRSDGKAVLKPIIGCAQGGADVPCPACAEFKLKDSLARCLVCLGFGVVPRLVAEWWIERWGDLRRAAA